MNDYGEKVKVMAGWSQLCWSGRMERWLKE